MKIALLLLAAGALAAPCGCASPGSSSNSTASSTNSTSNPSSADGKAIFDHMQSVYEASTKALLSGSCTKENLRVRKNWSHISKAERLNYLNAVQCFHSKAPAGLYPDIPGVKNRYDEFVYAHLNQTNFIHVSGFLLPWHRQFTWAYEEALRNECGYNGTQPYWDWAESSDNQIKSAVFDGSETSFGSTGQPIPHGVVSGVIPGLLLNGTFPFPVSRDPGQGGGCVTDGFFGNNFTVNLGPVVPANNTPDNLYGTAYNPRCLKRDTDNRISQQGLNYSDIANLMQSPSIHEFRPSLDFNMHPAAHRFGGGDLFDLFTSPNDPVFYLLHGQIDRLWTVWQGQDYASRTLALDGTMTFLNTPPSANVTLDTTMIMGAAGGDMPVRDAMSALGSKYCYIYK